MQEIRLGVNKRALVVLEKVEVLMGLDFDEDCATHKMSKWQRKKWVSGKKIDSNRNTINSHCVYAAMKEFILIKNFGTEHNKIDKKTMTSTEAHVQFKEYAEN